MGRDSGRALLGACALILSATIGPTPDARASKVDGACVVRGGGRFRAEGAHDWRETKPNDVLTSGVSVEASAGEALEMLLPDGVTVDMEPGTVARWAMPGRLPTENNRFTHGYHLVLVEGELDVRMPVAAKGAHAFLVSTKAGTLTDWRGTLHVSSHEDTTAAAIYEGALVVGSNGQGFPVYDGAGIVMRKGVDPDKSRVIPSAPRWLPSGRGMPAFAAMPAGASAPVGVSWEPVPGASKYRVVVASDADMKDVVQRAATVETTFGLVDNGTGTPYWAQVRAVGAEGIVGEWSAARPLRVLRYQLPDGAIVARDGVVVLPKGTSIRFADAEGIEVAFESVGSLSGRIQGIPLFWSRLTGSLHLPEDAPMRIVHLRASGADGEAQLVLAARQLRADIDLSPKNAQPGDALDVRVVVWDPSARVDAASESVTLEVLHDLDPIHVAWQRPQGPTGPFAARIRTSPETRPSVVRVIAKDGTGAEIGRGFLEIARTTASSR
jgi:hypothetical protein